MACSVTRWVYDGTVSVLQYPKDSGIGLAAFRPSFREADAMSIERRFSLRKRKTVSELHAEFRGLYIRVARKAGVDPSYVSRVARGQRESPLVEEMLRSELEKILKGFV